MSAVDDLGRVVEAMRRALERHPAGSVEAARDAQNRLAEKTEKTERG